MLHAIGVLLLLLLVMWIWGKLTPEWWTPGRPW